MRWKCLLGSAALFALGIAPAFAANTNNAANSAAPCASQNFESSTFTVCRFDSREQEIRLALKGANGVDFGGFRQLAKYLGADSDRVLFAMNAGMFNPDGAPTGWFVAGGVEQKPLNLQDGHGNFYLKPNGVFSVDSYGGIHIETTFSSAVRQTRPVLATQSGPMLVIEGALNPNFDPDGNSKFVRNGVGQLDTHTAFFAISEGPVSFGRFARFFRDALHCQNALYFDGAISSLWEPATGRRDDAHILGPMVVVLTK